MLSRVIGRPLMVLAIATALFVSPFAPSAHAATDLGGIDVNEYCRIKYGGEAILVSWFSYDAYSWRCQAWTWSVPPSLNLYNVSMTEACEMRYGAGAWASTSDPSNPFSWRCYR